MRTTPEECAELGRILAEKVNVYRASRDRSDSARKAISVISAAGQPFHDSAADAALFDRMKSNLRADIPVIEMETTINDPAFATACAESLLAQMESRAAGLSEAGTVGDDKRTVI